MESSKDLKSNVINFKMYFLWCILIFLSSNVNAERDYSFLKWKTFDYNLPNDVSLNSNDYIPLNNIPFGVSHASETLFISLPRRNPGMPSTLNYINIKSIETRSPKLTPYPSYEANQLHPNLQSDPNRIVSVYRTRIDACNRLWFIDTGLLQYRTNITRIQAPSIWVINLKNNNIIRRFEIPESSISDGRGLASLAVDVDSDNCDKAFAYIPDLFLFRLHVYSLEENHLWSFTHSYFYPDPLWADFDVAGFQFQFRDGIFSITLGNKNPDGFRTAYFHSLASTSEFVVSTKVLRNETNALRGYHGNDFIYLGNRGAASQSSLHAFDARTEIMFFAEINQNAITCWNTNRKLKRDNMCTVLEDREQLIYLSDLSIDSDGVLWAISNRIPIAIYSTLNSNDYNFRVFKIGSYDAIKNTKCNPYF